MIQLFKRKRKIKLTRPRKTLSARPVGKITRKNGYSLKTRTLYDLGERLPGGIPVLYVEKQKREK